MNRYVRTYVTCACYERKTFGGGGAVRGGRGAVARAAAEKEEKGGMRGKNVLLPLIPLRVFLSRCRLFPFPPFPSSAGRELTDPRFPRCGCDSKIVRKKRRSSFREKCFNVSFLPFLLAFFLFSPDSVRQKSGEEGGAKKEIPPILLLATAHRLALHLPRSSLKSVMGALIRGKMGYACLVLTPRFSDSDPTSTLMTQLQVNINNAARAITGVKNSDKIRIEDLLEEASLPSLNRLVIYTIAMESWRALSLRDVANGPLNPLGALLSRSQSHNPPRTRAAISGCLPPPAKHLVHSFTWWGYTCWNSSPKLRAAKTVSAAKRAANELAAMAPL